MATIAARTQQRRRTLAQWASENPVLAAGEMGLATNGTDSPPAKFGDGSSAWNSLPWHNGLTAISIPSTSMHAGSLTRLSTFRVPRIELPNGSTNSVIVGPQGLPTWWFERGVIMGFDCVNEHTATGDVRWRFRLQANDIGGQISTEELQHDETTTIGSPGANTGIATHYINGANRVTLTAAFFGTLWTMELQRIGGDAADTLGGSISICEFVFLAAN